MARKPWDELSPGYRRRLERFGIGPAEHSSGKPLYQARGHFPRDEAAGRVAGRSRIQGGRVSYREASREWERIRREIRGLPAPLRQVLRNAILVERQSYKPLNDRIIDAYRNAADSFESDPVSGQRGDIVDALDSDLFEIQYGYSFLDYHWMAELDIWYH